MTDLVCAPQQLKLEGTHGSRANGTYDLQQLPCPAPCLGFLQCSCLQETATQLKHGLNHLFLSLSRRARFLDSGGYPWMQHSLMFCYYKRPCKTQTAIDELSPQERPAEIDGFPATTCISLEILQKDALSCTQPRGPKDPKIRDFERDWKFRARMRFSTEPPTAALFFVGNSRRRDWNFRARSKISIEIENFERDWLFFLIVGPSVGSAQTQIFQTQISVFRFF